MNVLTHKYPDTSAGAIECLRSLACDDLDSSEARAYPDPKAEGVWMISGLRLRGETGRAIVYLGGYGGFSENDFETDLD